MIGLSLPLCLKDIAAGRISLEKVQRIYSLSESQSEDAWIREVNTYRDTYWRNLPDVVLLPLLNSVLERVVRVAIADKIPIAPSLWVRDESEIIWQQPRRLR